MELEDPGASRGDRGRAALLYGAAITSSAAAPWLVGRVARRTSRARAEALVSAGLVGAAWAGIALLERRHPHREDWQRSGGPEPTDVALLVVGGAVAAAVGAALAPLRHAIRAHSPMGRALGRAPRPIQVAVSVASFDLVHARFHRAAHEWAPLWRFHAVHHQPDRLSWSNATRFHPFETVVDAAAEALVLDALGLDADALVAHRVFRGIFGQIQHANVALSSGPLSAVLSTPERHRWHHSTDLAAANANYGAVVSIWDHAWGTARLPPGPMLGPIGLADTGSDPNLVP